MTVPTTSTSDSLNLTLTIVKSAYLHIVIYLEFVVLGRGPYLNWFTYLVYKRKGDGLPLSRSKLKLQYYRFVVLFAACSTNFS